MVTVSAPGNVFFLGEHSIVYERPAIVAAVGFRTYAEVRPRSDGLVVVSSLGYDSFKVSLQELVEKKWAVRGKAHPEGATNDYKPDGKTMDVSAPAKDFLGRLIENYDIKQGFELTLRSDIPRESGGMSSSTAFLSAVLGALNQQYELGLEPKDYFDVLLPFQVKIHGGAASGSEVVSSSLGGYNWVRINRSGPSPVLEKRNLGQQELYLVIGNTGITGLTAETVGYVRSGLEQNDISRKAYERVFDRIAELTVEAEEAIRDSDARLLGDLMNQDHELLARSLGVSHPMLNELVDAARRAGAYGAKMSGGGKGGVMVALTDKENQKRVAEAIKSAGGIPYITEVGVEGVRLEK